MVSEAAPSSGDSVLLPAQVKTWLTLFLTLQEKVSTPGWKVSQ